MDNTPHRSVLPKITRVELALFVAPQKKFPEGAAVWWSSPLSVCPWAAASGAVGAEAAPAPSARARSDLPVLTWAGTQVGRKHL